MIPAAMDEYLRTLTTHVYDHDKVVTYKWLSKQLEIHVNTAKQVLWDFWEKHKKDGNVECTFMLMGTLKDGTMRVEVVRGPKVSEAKEKFKEIISEHLYSVQKSLPDIELLAISGEGDSRFSAIKCNECTERNDVELSTLRWGTFSNGIQSATNEKKDERDKKENKVEKEHEREDKQSRDSPDKHAPIKGHSKSPDKKAKGSKKPTGTQKSGFNSLFGKAIGKQSAAATAASREKAVSPTEQSEVKNSSPKSNVSPSSKEEKGTLKSFFGTENQQRKEESPSGNGTQNDKNEAKSPVTAKPSTSQNKKKDSRGKKRHRSEDKGATKKKRKRIIVDSESSDEDSKSENEEEVVPSSPEQTPMVVEKSPSPPRIKHEGGKKKVLKVVDRMTEEDGFIVTRKVHVYESCSEDEVDNAKEKELEKAEPKAEPNAKKNTKQTTLMNFFKKS